MPHDPQSGLGTIPILRSHFKPTYELRTVRRESWLPPLPGTKLYERDGDDTD